MVREKDAVRVDAWVREAVDQGARVVVGGQRQGAIYAPTVVVDVKPEMRISCDELFGPAVFERGRGGAGMWLEMKVKGLALEPLSNMPMIILRDEEDKCSLPIWVGLFEANAIALELDKISPPRPMTHDLIKKILESLDARVQKIVVTDVRDNTFYAIIHLRLGHADITVDSRPSDAIALALRVGAPIFVDEEVVHKARTVEVAKETEIGTGKGDDPAKIKEWLDSLKPDDFDRIERGKDPNRPDE